MIPLDDPAPDSPPDAALLTPRGRGAIATVRLRRGESVLDRAEPPLFRAANGRRLSEQPIGRVLFGHWGRDPAEEVVVCRRDAQTLEIHCHGGDAAVRRILSDLESIGCTTIAWTDQSTAEHGLLATECLEALSRATTLRTADILLDQAEGTLRAAIEGLRGEHFGFRISDSGSGAEPADFRNPKSEIRNASSLLSWASFGLHLTRPWRVVITGRPNVGKSSLINALLGYARSIVFDQPGTTRDVVTAETALAGWPVRLADTAGLRADASEIEAAGISRAREHLAAADCRVVVLDASRPPEPDDWRLLGECPGAVVVANKSDLPDAWAAATPEGALRVSCLTSAGVETLADAIALRLVPRAPPPGTAVPITERQVDLLQCAKTAAAAGDLDKVRSALDELLRRR
jgi:tRNA modification GTPase